MSAMQVCTQYPQGCTGHHWGLTGSALVEGTLHSRIQCTECPILCWGDRSSVFEDPTGRDQELGPKDKHCDKYHMDGFLLGGGSTWDFFHCRCERGTHSVDVRLYR
jgi:aldehyde:ferredoxin oxidoreductase